MPPSQDIKPTATICPADSQSWPAAGTAARLSQPQKKGQLMPTHQAYEKASLSSWYESTRAARLVTASLNASWPPNHEVMISWISSLSQAMWVPSGALWSKLQQLHMAWEMPFLDASCVCMTSTEWKKRRKALTGMNKQSMATTQKRGRKVAKPSTVSGNPTTCEFEAANASRGPPKKRKDKIVQCPRQVGRMVNGFLPPSALFRNAASSKRHQSLSPKASSHNTSIDSDVLRIPARLTIPSAFKRGFTWLMHIRSTKTSFWPRQSSKISREQPSPKTNGQIQITPSPP
mmetsp:Transcript_61305/g.146123  ORF Transcript_61305/g.146123 Transcript_61305/m.146123 type:complete len:289 (+) Transcript_61305:511-1377(+)